MNMTTNTPIAGMVPASDPRLPASPDSTVHTGAGPRIDPGTLASPSHVRPLLAQPARRRTPLRRKDEDGPDEELGGSDATSSDQP